MVKRIAPLAAGVALAATAGCWTALPVAVSTLNDPEIIDLSKGEVAKPGYSKVTVTVNGLPDFRKVSTFNTDGASLSIAVTDADHSKLTDANGAEGVYTVKVTSGSAKITLPGLPNSKSVPTTSTPFYDGASAYHFTTFLWAADPGTDTTPALSELAAYGTAAGTSGFRWDALHADVTAAYAADPDDFDLVNLLGSGASRADVVPGLPINVSITNTAHVNRIFSTSAGLEGDNSMVIKASGGGAGNAGVVSESGTSVLRLRLPGIDPDTVTEKPSDTERHVRFVVTFGSSTTGVKLTAASFDPADSEVGTTLANNVALGTTLPSTTLNTTTTTANAGKTHYVDVDMDTLAGGTKHIVDLKFTGFASYTDLRMLPLYYTGILSHSNGKSNFN